jgi:hypothetical protein
MPHYYYYYYYYYNIGWYIISEHTPEVEARCGAV